MSHEAVVDEGKSEMEEFAATRYAIRLDEVEFSDSLDVQHSMLS
jgi:hypothetical protein